MAGWALVVAPLFVLLGEVVHPQRRTDPADQLSIVSGHSTAWYVSHLLLFAGIALMLPAIAGIAYLIYSRARRLAVVGASLAFVGAVCFAGLLTIGFVVWQMTSRGSDRYQMAALFTRLFHAPGFVVPFEVLPLFFAFGMVLLAVGLGRAGCVPRWMTVCLGTGGVAVSLIGIVPGSTFAIVASFVFAAGTIPIGKLLLTPRSRSVPAPIAAARVNGTGIVR